MVYTISHKADFNNEVGKTFEKHSGILFDKILKKENSTYFNIKFNIVKAINKIKENLLKKLFIEKDRENEIKIYLEIKELIKICDKYLIKAKGISKDFYSSYDFSINTENDSNKDSFDSKIMNCKKKYASAKQNKTGIKENNFLQIKKNNLGKTMEIKIKEVCLGPSTETIHLPKKVASADEKQLIKKRQDAPKNQNINNSREKNRGKESKNSFKNNISENEIKSINNCSENDIEFSSKDIENESGNSSNNKKKKKDKNLSKGEIDVLIADVTKEEFKVLIDKECNKYFVSNYAKDLPSTFNIIIEACVNLSTKMNEKKDKLKNTIS